MTSEDDLFHYIEFGSKEDGVIGGCETWAAELEDGAAEAVNVRAGRGHGGGQGVGVIGWQGARCDAMPLL